MGWDFWFRRGGYFGVFIMGLEERELLKDAWYQMAHGSTGGLNLSPSHRDSLGLNVEFCGWNCTNAAWRAHHLCIWKP